MTVDMGATPLACVDGGFIQHLQSLAIVMVCCVVAAMFP